MRICLITTVFLLLCIATCITAKATSPPPTPTTTEHVKKPHALLIAIPAAGHMSPLISVGHELVKRGYKVSVAMTEDLLGIYNLTAFNYISLGKTPNSNEAAALHAKQANTYSNLVWGYLQAYKTVITPWMITMYTNVFADTSRFDDVDVIIEDMLSMIGSDMSIKLNKPCVSINPTLIFDFNLNTPSIFTGLGKHMTFTERIKSFINKQLLLAASLYGLWNAFVLKSELGFPALVDFEVGQCTRLVLAAPGFEYPRKTPPNSFPVGPLISFPLSPIADPLKGFLDAQLAENTSVLLIAMGTSVQLVKWQIHSLIEAVANQPYKVLFALTIPNLNELLPAVMPANVRIEGFIPQQSVLSHPAVKVFLSHCGMGSAQEGLFFGKPILGMGFHYDQPDVAARIVDAGAGLAINRFAFTAEEVRAKIHSLLHEPSYKQAAERVAAVYKLAGGVSRSAEIVDFVRRFGGQVFHPIEKELPWYQSSLLDMYAVIAVVLLFAFVVCKLLLRTCCCCCCCCKATKSGAEKVKKA